jgi:hypothetical protein
MKNDTKTDKSRYSGSSLLPSLPILLLSSLPHFYLFLYSLFCWNATTPLDGFPSSFLHRSFTPFLTLSSLFHFFSQYS